jgi:threonine dehydratase
MDTQAESIINQGDSARAERLIRPHVRRTPVIEVDTADFALPAARLSFKLELLQHAGSFKTRGAFSNLVTRNIREPAKSPHPAAIMGRRLPMRP